jgi:hypothetical protein
VPDCLSTIARPRADDSLAGGAANSARSGARYPFGRKATTTVSCVVRHGPSIRSMQ